MRALSLLLMFFLSACGFKPLYQNDGSTEGVSAFLADIAVAPIADRLGQQMRNQLITDLNGSGSARYELRVTLNQESLGYGTRPDAAATQEQLTVNADVELYDRAIDQVVYRDQLTARTSFDLVLSDFSNVVQREDSARRLALEMGEQLHRRLALYYRTSRPASDNESD